MRIMRDVFTYWRAIGFGYVEVDQCANLHFLKYLFNCFSLAKLLMFLTMLSWMILQVHAVR